MPDQHTFPETTIFKWEHRRYAYEEAAELMDGFAKQGGSEPRRKAYIRAMHLIREADHADIGSNEITGSRMKELLIQAAHEVGWWDKSARRTFTKPPPVPSGQKVCYVCKEAKPVLDFLITPTAAQAKRYGWKPDTKKKVPTHVCGTCRKKRADAQRLKRGKRAPQLRTLLKEAVTPEQAVRLQDYERVLAQINKHKSRVNSAIYQVRVVLPAVDSITGEESMFTDYQFRDEDTRRFYFMKRDLLDIARHRLSQMLGETAPIPAKWGMLLTKEEQQELAFLHDDVFGGQKKVHQLW